jgi:hypothetical protein
MSPNQGLERSLVAPAQEALQELPIADVRPLTPQHHPAEMFKQVGHGRASAGGIDPASTYVLREDSRRVDVFLDFG